MISRLFIYLFIYLLCLQGVPFIRVFRAGGVRDGIVLVKRLGGLSLPRNSMVRIVDRSANPIAV